MTSRAAAFEALKRIDHQGAYANLVLGAVLERAELSSRDRGFATQLVYGTTRMRRACDHLVDRFLLRDVDDDVRTILRLGAYQLHYLSTPKHAAVGETVELASRKTRGFVNAVLRKVADADVVWPSEAVRLSYPDWLVERLIADHGEADAVAMLEQMNVEPEVHERSDGYVQDLASQWVCDAIGAHDGDTVLDVCAAPGGKATLLAATGAHVVAADRRLSRAKLVASNIERLDATSAYAIVADGIAPPYRPGAFDRVLVDAPCSGLGVLRRRADARWRIDAEAIERLTRLQANLLATSASLVKPGGSLVYSVCTVTHAETVAIAETLNGPFTPVDVVGSEERWRRWGSGGLIMANDHGTDGMALFVWQRTS